MSEREIEVGEFAGCGEDSAKEIIDAIDLAADQDQMTWLTAKGKRIAAVVPVEQAEVSEVKLPREEKRLMVANLEVRTVPKEEDPPEGKAGLPSPDELAATFTDVMADIARHDSEIGWLVHSVTANGSWYEPYRESR